MLRFRLDCVKSSEDFELVRFLANFLRDDFIARVQRLTHSDNVRRHLGEIGRQRGV